jgi:hypothetical protein
MSWNRVVVKRLRLSDAAAGQYILTLTVFESGDIGQGCPGNGFYGIMGKECLVAGDDDIGEHQQTGENVILDDLV